MSDAGSGDLPLDDGNGTDPAAENGPDSAVDPQRTEKIGRKKRSEARESDAFWYGVFSTEQGRREIWGILSELHPFDAHLANSPVGFPDERATWMHLGRQLTGQRLFQKWYARFPQLVLLMQAENDPKFPKPVK